MTASETLRKTLDKNKEIYLKRFQELIAIDTENIGHGILGGKEYQGQLYLEKLLREMGFQTKKQAVLEKHIVYAAEHLFEGNPGHNYSHPNERYNLFGTLVSEKKGKSILFNGHMDTMPAGDISRWSVPPFQGTIKDGNIYGLGTADMKGGLIASVMAVHLIKDAGLPLGGDITIMSVADEEGGGNGTLSACLEGIKADYCVVAECSDKSITRAHMGFIIMDIEVSGVALHCGKKWEGENAVEKSISIIEALRDLEHQWLMAYRHDILPSPTINIGVIQGGTAASTVPDKCLFKICAHILPTMNIKKCLGQILDTIRRRAETDAFLRKNPPVCTVTQQGNGFELPKEHSFAQAALSASKKVFGKTRKLTGSPSGNDARIIQKIAQCPTLIIGPGSLDLCHSVDEHIEVQDYLDNILLYAALILEINNTL